MVGPVISVEVSVDISWSNYRESRESAGDSRKRATLFPINPGCLELARYRSIWTPERGSLCENGSRKKKVEPRDRGRENNVGRTSFKLWSKSFLKPFLLLDVSVHSSQSSHASFSLAHSPQQQICFEEAKLIVTQAIAFAGPSAWNSPHPYPTPKHNQPFSFLPPSLSSGLCLNTTPQRCPTWHSSKEVLSFIPTLFIGLFPH